MNFEEYQKLSKRTANYPNIGTKKEDAFLYPVLGLAGELKRKKLAETEMKGRK